ncbi:MAG: prolipoprotein diacylglyceryl transferase [Bacteroidetes bacterium]|nr:prolipoprotein diacylglyceryl transferase [Bacteroidota bacterium]MBK9320287.1 prolipoprotein diacylglyceryl transferase [Bacteroidota bacterium]
MYPTISDLLHDLFGLNLPLPIQSFGFMLALSFLLAAYTVKLELIRKEKLGLVKSHVKESMKGAAATFSDLASSFLIGFVLGYKFVYAAINYSLFVEDTQGVLLSLTGNPLGGLLVGSLMAYMQYREKEKERLPQPKMVQETVHPFQLVSNITIIAAISGIIGAKIFHNLENLHEFRENPLEALISFSGLTMYGGLIAGTIAVMRYGSKNGMPPLVLADATAPGLMLSYGTGRLGCQISGDGDWGIVNLSPKPDWLSWLPDWFWAYDYPHNVISAGVPIPGCEGKHCMVLPETVFPTPLYEALACVLLFFVLWGFRKKLVRTGQLFFLYLIFNGIERFLIEKIRVNNKFDFLGMTVTQAEVIASALIITGIAGYIYCSKKHHPDGRVATG